jgi:hypothetical protein
MFNGAFEEAASQSALLPEDDPKDFEKFQELLYHGTIMSIVLEQPGCVAQADELADLYQFATKYLLDELADRALSGIIKYFKLTRLVLSPTEVVQIYEALNPGKLREFMSDWAAYSFLYSTASQFQGFHSTDSFMNAFKQSDGFMLDVLGKIRHMRDNKDPREGRLCKYHHHAEARTCPYGHRNRTAAGFDV